MIPTIDTINILVATVAILNTLYGLLVYSRNRKDTTNRSFFFLTLCVSSWGVAMFVFRSLTDPAQLIWVARFLYATAALIPFASVYFSKIFPEKQFTFTFPQRWIIPTPFLLMVYWSLTPYGGVITDAYARTGQESVIVFNQLIHSIYIIFIVGYFLWVYAILFSKLFRASGILRTQLIYILIGTMTTTWVAVFTNLLLPFFKIYMFNWAGQIGVFAMITSITYSILKHHLFNIKVIVTEGLVFSLSLTLFSRIFLAESFNERIISIVVFAISALIGILLVRSVIKEVEAREEIQRLAENLKVANEKLKELDVLKSQFLSIASHDLRSPLTVIRNFMSLLLDGTYGKVPPASEEGLRQVYERATDMAHSVDSYLNVSRIEQGRMKYDFVQEDLVKMVKDAVAGFKIAAEQKGLTLNMSLSAALETIPVKVDRANINEVLNNLLDNAIKYTPKGSVYVTLEKRGDVARISIKDSGKGIDEKTKAGLFKLFSPGADSKKINPNSTGVGLYITRAHVEAHKGKIWAESAGDGKGSTFVVELPILTQKKDPLS